MQDQKAEKASDIAEIEAMLTFRSAELKAKSTVLGKTVALGQFADRRNSKIQGKSILLLLCNNDGIPSSSGGIE